MLFASKGLIWYDFIPLMFQSMTAPGQIDDEAVVYLVAAVLLLIVFTVVGNA